MTDPAAAAWKLEHDADGIAWLTLDKPDTSANVLSGPVLVELDAFLGQFEAQRPRGVVLISGQEERLHRRRRYQRIHRARG